MKKAPLIILVILVLAGGGYAIFHKSDKATPSSTSTTNTGTSDNTNSSNSTPSTATETTAPSIKNMAFTPPTIKVKKGTKVTWTNDDSTTHTVTGDNGGPASDNLSPGDSYSFTFDTAGTFNYHCSIHSSMTGTVIVE